MKTLTPNTYVRLPQWPGMTYATFNTVRSCAIRNQHSIFKRDPEAEHARAVKNGHQTAFAIHAGYMLVDDGGHYYRREAERAKQAVTLEDGEIVAIEGEPEIYKVRVIKGNEKGPRNSDPIHFDTVSQ